MSKNIVFKNAMVYTDGAFRDTDVFVKDGIITAFRAPCCSFESIVQIDCGGNFLVPGFIDIHTHGGAGVDVNRAREEDFERLSAFFASKGVSAYLASVLTDSEENTLRTLDTIVRYQISNAGGAKLLGAHLEGPFLSAAKKGAMPQQFLKPADEALFEKYAASGAVKYITIAPEISGAIGLIEKISKSIPVAVGHSAADYAGTLAAIRAGAVASTHTFNAMQAIDRTEPHILGAVLESDVYNEIIADGKHVHPANMRLLYRLKGNRKIIAITDSIEAAGMPDGEYKLGINEVSVANGEAFIKGTHSRAGSVLCMDTALRNMVQFLGISLEQALPMFTENPAKLLKLNKGCIRCGYDADFVLLDKALQVRMTFRGGEAIYQAH